MFLQSDNKKLTVQVLLKERSLNFLDSKLVVMTNMNSKKEEEEEEAEEAEVAEELEEDKAAEEVKAAEEAEANSNFTVVKKISHLYEKLIYKST